MALVPSHTAAELCTEATIATLLTRRNLGALTEALWGIFRATDICDDRLRGVYLALSADQQLEDPKGFWPKFKESRKLRHGVVHKGEPCTMQQARDSVEAVTQLIKHLEQQAIAVTTDSGKAADTVDVQK